MDGSTNQINYCWPPLCAATATTVCGGGPHRVEPCILIVAQRGLEVLEVGAFTAKTNVAFSHVACADPNCREQTESAQLDATVRLHSDQGGRRHNWADCRAAR